jgi:hypothetical protein
MNERGFSLAELLVSMLIAVGITGTVLGLVMPMQDASLAQPELADLSQRMRVVSDRLQRDLLMAGAGADIGAGTGTQAGSFAAILPRRTGRRDADAHTVARSDAITLSFVPGTSTRTTAADPVPAQCTAIRVNQEPSCPPGLPACGLTGGMEAVIFDRTGNFDVFRVEAVAIDAVQVRHRGDDAAAAYAAGAVVAQIETHTYYFDADHLQLRHYDGYDTDLPVVDNVVGLTLEYFGEPGPPRHPRPPSGVENCLYDAQGNSKVALPGIPSAGATLEAIPLSAFSDGPWCGSGSNMFDADLSRVRRIRVVVRLQVASDSLRGTDPALFARPGLARGGGRFIPDFSMVFEIAPRNLN